MIGLLAAAIILLIMFGLVVAAGLPILVAVAGLAVSSTLTTVVISFVDAPDWSTSLATMMGIGIGIDYALLMVTRFREWRAAGLDPEAATAATLDTAGRSVMVAGTTVVMSMLGLFAMGLSFMRGAAVVTILAVLVVMLASITLFPRCWATSAATSTGCASRWADLHRGRRRRRARRAVERVARRSRLVARHRGHRRPRQACLSCSPVLAAPFLDPRNDSASPTPATTGSPRARATPTTRSRPVSGPG